MGGKAHPLDGPNVYIGLKALAGRVFFSHNNTMKLTNIVLSVVSVVLLAAPAARAQKLQQLAQAVGGVSIQEIQTQAMLRCQLKAAYRPHFSKEAVCCVSKVIPTHTQHIASVEQLFKRTRHLPQLRTAVSVDPFPGIELEAVKIPDNSYISQELLFIPANSYALRLPDGQYRFSTPARPFQNALQARLEQAFAPRAPATEREEAETGSQQSVQGWPGKPVYLDTNELAQDVVKYFKPLKYYANTPFGPVYLYDVPEGVTYLTSQGRSVVLHANGTYAILKQARTGELKFINKQVYHFDVAPQP